MHRTEMNTDTRSKKIPVTETDSMADCDTFAAVASAIPAGNGVVVDGSVDFSELEIYRCKRDAIIRNSASGDDARQ